MEFKHVSVMYNECIEGLNVKPEGIYVDGTLGGAGHSKGIVSKLTSGKLICNDLDTNAIGNAKTVLGEYLQKTIFIHDDYKNLCYNLDELGIDKVDGILLDLGVSSPQIDDPNRGFSYSKPAPLDMRMDRRQQKSAYDVVNTYSERDLMRILRDYGEEKFARSIARHIVKARTSKPIETTKELEDIILSSVPRYKGQDGKSNVQRTFQAIRIEVNRELDVLSSALEQAIELLDVGGRICVITFHSLEDRMVKNFLRSGNLEGKIDKDFYGNILSPFKVIEKGLTASAEEVERNPRARSAKLRVAEKL